MHGKCAFVLSDAILRSGREELESKPKRRRRSGNQQSPLIRAAPRSTNIAGRHGRTVTIRSSMAHRCRTISDSRRPERTRSRRASRFREALTVDLKPGPTPFFSGMPGHRRNWNNGYPDRMIDLSVVVAAMSRLSDCRRSGTYLRRRCVDECEVNNFKGGRWPIY
jgi:hypothetical protein